MTTMDRAKDTASKNRNNKFILDALNGLIDGRQFITTLVYRGEEKRSNKERFLFSYCLFLTVLETCIHVHVIIFNVPIFFRNFKKVDKNVRSLQRCNASHYEG